VRRRSAGDSGQYVAARSTFQRGELIADRYCIVRFLAEGGMGEVYEAEDLELQVRVALKTLRASLDPDTDTLARFKREVNLARSVTHPNVCRIFDFGIHKRVDDHERVPFFTMEYLEGVTLSERLQQGPMAPDEAFPLVVQMTQALDAAHAAGIIHRDFKSPNVMLLSGPKTRVKVTDFGLARAGEVTGKGGANSEGYMLHGSPGYMAPEQVWGHHVTKAADIYALGVVLFEMLTAELPFMGDTAMVTAMMRLTVKARSPRAVVHSVPLTWERVVLRCLAREPAERFASAGDVARELQPPSSSTLRNATIVVSAIGCIGLTAVGWQHAHRAPVAPAPVATPRTPIVPSVPVEPAATGTSVDQPQSVVVRSEPAGAQVFVDGRAVGRAPALVKMHLPQEVTLVHPGYQTAREVVARAGEVTIRLERRRATKAERGSLGRGSRVGHESLD
jgi:tRNA A-37 threonylcarbamoyl transferase component Bud32